MLPLEQLQRRERERAEPGSNGFNIPSTKNDSGISVRIMTGCKLYTISTGFDKPVKERNIS